MKSLNFRDQEVKKIVLSWWSKLQVMRGWRAELSRRSREDEIYQTPAYNVLRHALRDYQVFDPALARTAAVLSRIRRDRDGESFGILLGGCCHESRVKRLLKKRGDRLTRELSTLIKLLRGEAPVCSTADLVYWWEVRHPNRDFLYDFYSQSNKEIVHA